jgi:hypothetical protein
MTAIESAQNTRMGPRSRKRDLRDLAGLEGGDAQTDPGLCAVDVPPDDRQERQHEQRDRDEAGDVAVALERPVVAHDDQHGGGGGDRDGRPGDLPHTESIPAEVALGDVESRDLGDAEEVEQCRDGHQERVGLRRDDAQHDVQYEDEHREADDEAEHARVDAAEGSELGEDECADADPDRDDQQGELEVAATRGGAEADADRPREGRRRAARLDRRARHDARSLPGGGAHGTALTVSRSIRRRD